MLALIVSRLLYRAPEVRWNRHLTIDGSALADIIRKSTLTNRKEAHPHPLSILHRKSTPNRPLYWRTVVVESNCEEAGSSAYHRQISLLIGQLCGV
jgi:hypothetical protein